jgi:U6 snRNA-associated Sm-like protein LSm1
LQQQDLDKEDDIPANLRQASPQEVLELKKQEESERRASERRRHAKLQAHGFEPEHSGEVLF